MRKNSLQVLKITPSKMTETINKIGVTFGTRDRIHWGIDIVSIDTEVSVQWSRYRYRGQRVVKNRKLLNGFEGLYMKSSKTYAEPL